MDMFFEHVHDAPRQVAHVTATVDEPVDARLHIVGRSVAATPVGQDHRKTAVDRFGDGE